MLAKVERDKRLEAERPRKEEELKWLKHKAEERRLEVKEMMSKKKLQKTDPVLTAFMVKDYFMLWPAINAEAVLERLSVYDRVMQIREACVGAHPDAAFEFCLDYPDGGPLEFQELREKMRSVFRLEGARILYNLPKSKRESLKETPLADVYAEFEARDARQIVHSHLEKMVGGGTAAEIMAHPACQHRLKIGGFEPSVAQKLVEFWEEKDDEKKRTLKLIKAFDKHNRSSNNDCKFRAQYVQGAIDCDVEEVRAVVAIYNQLRLNHVSSFGTRLFVGRMEFCHQFYEEHRSFASSMNWACDHAMRCFLSKVSCSYHHCSLLDEVDDGFIEEYQSNDSSEGESDGGFGQEYDYFDSMDDEYEEDSDCS